MGILPGIRPRMAALHPIPCTGHTFYARYKAQDGNPVRYKAQHGNPSTIFKAKDVNPILDIRSRMSVLHPINAQDKCSMSDIRPMMAILSDIRHNMAILARYKA